MKHNSRVHEHKVLQLRNREFLKCINYIPLATHMHTLNSQSLFSLFKKLVCRDNKIQVKLLLLKNLKAEKGSPWLGMVGSHLLCETELQSLRDFAKLHFCDFSYFFSACMLESSPLPSQSTRDTKGGGRDENSCGNWEKKTPALLSTSCLTLTTQTKFQNLALTYGRGPANHYSGSKQGHLKPSTSRTDPFTCQMTQFLENHCLCIKNTD